LNEVELCGLTACQSDALEIGLTKLHACMPPGGQAVVKLGPRGAMALDDSHSAIEVAAPPVKVVDTIGAGDCFNAGFLWAQIRDHGLQSSMKIGVNIASNAISTSPREYTGIAAVSNG
ncbi:MAG: PfkB family carbohydrate kinase, partial [Alphaproteobacteria bacterium]